MRYLIALLLLPFALHAFRDFDHQVTERESGELHYIITTLADTSLPALWPKEGHIRAAGERINHIHPLKQLLTILSNERTKVAFRNVRKRGIIWRRYSSEYADSFKREDQEANVTAAQIEYVAEQLGVDPKLLLAPFKSKDWKKLLDVLATQVPRKGDPRRYEM